MARKFERAIERFWSSAAQSRAIGKTSLGESLPQIHEHRDPILMAEHPERMSFSS
jgi:hypothetical protein